MLWNCVAKVTEEIFCSADVSLLEGAFSESIQRAPTGGHILPTAIFINLDRDDLFVYVPFSYGLGKFKSTTNWPYCRLERGACVLHLHLRDTFVLVNKGKKNSKLM